ncbi:MAG: TonB-dependent receptor [Flavobacteriaceae bacterium]|nr:TonB-dependent receptor [Bacteroidia bacterium]NNL15684.1 TonB-dependent receptor [Flavobacteriaceae bacterium]
MKQCISLFFLFFSALVFSQEVTILNQVTYNSIPGVAIYNESKTTSAFTDLNGKVNLNIFKGTDRLFFQHISYKTLIKTKNEILKGSSSILLRPNPQSLNEIVVSASKFMQSKEEIPQKILSLDAKNIALANPQTSADLLENSGKVFVQKSQLGGGSPMIRGFSTNRLLISVDDVRMNNAIFRGGNLQNIISIDPFSVRSSEIILGSGSVIYGSDAIGGVMSFYTQKPELSYTTSGLLKTNALLRYSTANNEKTSHLDFNFGFKKWAFLTNISYTDFDDLKMGKNGPEEYLRNEYVQRIDGEDMMVENEDPLIQNPTGYNQINFMQKVRFEQTQSLFFDLGIHYSATSEFSRYDRLLRYNNGNLRSAEWTYGPQKWFMANFKVTRISSKSNLYDKLKFTAAFQDFKESRFDRNYQSDIRNIRRENVKAYSFNLDLEKELSGKTEFNYGIEYLYNKVFSNGKGLNIDTNTSNQAVSRYPDGSDWQSVAAYSSLKYKPNNNFVLQSGLRYNHIIANADFTENNQFLNLPFNSSKVNTGALTGTAGITWTPNKTMQWRFNLATAFRAPNIDDIGKVFDSEPGSVVVPNQNLKPEYSYGGDLGLRLNFNDIVKVDLGTYYTYLDNALVRRDFELNGSNTLLYDGELSNIQAIQNASKAWIYGFETGIEVNFSKTFKLTSQYNFIGGTEEDEEIEVPIRHVAPSFGNCHLVYDNNRFKCDAFVVYNGELSYDQLAPSEREKSFMYATDSNGNPYSPTWYTLNFRTQYQINQKIQLTASFENISDQRYRPYSSGLTAPGRNLIMSVKYSL